MHRSHVRSLYDSEAVLRRLAGMLRLLGSNETSTLESVGRQALAPASHASTFRRQVTKRKPAAFLGALRRSREVVDMLDRALTGRSQHRSAGSPTATPRIPAE